MRTYNPTPEMNERQLRNTASQHLQNIDAEISQNVHLAPADRHVVVAAVGLHDSALLEGHVGTGKTTTANAVARAIGGILGRVQGNSDTMPADITGARIWNPGKSEFEFHEGPAFSNLLFVDELSRLPAKTQSGLIELMQERQVTITGENFSRPVPKPFIVFATQNHHENGEGTNGTTKANTDRFGSSVNYSYLTDADYLAIERIQESGRTSEQAIDDISDLDTSKAAIETVAMDEAVRARARRLIFAMRGLEHVEESDSMLGTNRPYQMLKNYAKAFALIQGHASAGEEHIDMAAVPVLRHRTIPTYEAMDNGITAEELIAEGLSQLPRTSK